MLMLMYRVPLTQILAVLQVNNQFKICSYRFAVYLYLLFSPDLAVRLAFANVLLNSKIFL